MPPSEFTSLGRGRARNFNVRGGGGGNAAAPGAGGDRGGRPNPNEPVQPPRREVEPTRSQPVINRRPPYQHGPRGDPNQMPPSEMNKQLVKQQLEPGIEGVPIELIGNFYRILTSEMMVHQYDVKIVKLRDARKNPDGSVISVQPMEDLPEERQAAQERFIKKFADLTLTQFIKENDSIFSNVPHVFDGYKNLFTTRVLVFENHQDEMTKNVRVDIEGRPATFSLTLKRVETVTLSEAIDFYQNQSQTPISNHVISVYDIIFRQIIGKEYTQHQRKFFDLKKAQQSNKTKICDFVPGFVNSVRMTEFGLSLNVHLKTACTIAKSYVKLIDLVSDILNLPPMKFQMLNRRQLGEVNKIIRHLKVFTQHSKSKVTYTIDRLFDQLPERLTMNKGNGQGPITIKEYFRTKYNINLLPLPVVKAVGNEHTYIPLELCFLHEAQFLRKEKFTRTIEQELLTKATHVPNAYFNQVRDIVETIKEADKDGLLDQFGVDLNPTAARFKGRVLPKPNTLKADSRDAFFTPGRGRDDGKISWLVCCYEKRNLTSQQLRSFADQLKIKARQFGLQLPDPETLEFISITTVEDIERHIRGLFVDINPDLVFIGIPTKPEFVPNKDMYNMVKHYCDQTFGMMSQCFDADKMPCPPRGYFETLLLKCNGKIGGRNSALVPDALKFAPFNPSRTMVVGIDISHPGQTERILSSVSAAVGSYDASFSFYNCSIRVQRKERDEMVKQLDDMIGELLIQYRTNNQYYPDHLIVFRDGISEGQIPKLKEIEIPLVVRAIARTGNPMKLTLLVVQKRHNTRFALTKANVTGRRPTFNVPSGTVVDQSIVDCNFKVFYLNSHFSPLGTSKSTKYILIRDDAGFTTDQIEKMCFYMCFNCVRTRNVIAIPVPVRYADLCAYRSKLHIEAQRSREELASQSDHSQEHLTPDQEAQVIANLNNKAVVSRLLRHRLYYC